MIMWRSCDHHVTPPKFGGVVVEEAELVQFFFDNLLDGVWHHQLLDPVPELLRDGVLVIFLREEEEEGEEERENEGENEREQRGRKYTLIRTPTE